MKEFKELVREGKVEKRTPDFAEAESLLQQAKERLNDLLTLSLNEQNASFRFESAYESLREALQAFLAKRGYKPYSHEAIIAFGPRNQGLTGSMLPLVFEISLKACLTSCRFQPACSRFCSIVV